MWRDVEGRPVKWNPETGAWRLVKIQEEDPFEEEEEEEEPFDTESDVSDSDLESYELDFDREKSKSRKLIQSLQNPQSLFDKNLVKRAGDNIPHALKLSEDQITSISLYTESFYTNINKTLRGEQVELDGEIAEFFQKRTDDMVSALKSLPNSPKQTYYRGFSEDKDSNIQKVYAGLKPGQTISDKAFSSYSTDPDVAKGFLDPEASNTFLILNSSKMKQIDYLSTRPEEFESLSMPGQRFRIKKNEVVFDRDAGANVRVILIEDDYSQIEYNPPNVEREWNEADRYPEFRAAGINAWKNAIRNGNPTKFSQLGRVDNVDLDYDSLEEGKKDNFQKSFENGVIEMPIVGRFEDGSYELIGGNTRIAGLTKNGIDPTVMVVDFPK